MKTLPVRLFVPSSRKTRLVCQAGLCLAVMLTVLPFATAHAKSKPWCSGNRPGGNWSSAPLNLRQMASHIREKRREVNWFAHDIGTQLARSQCVPVKPELQAILDEVMARWTSIPTVTEAELDAYFALVADERRVSTHEAKACEAFSSKRFDDQLQIAKDGAYRSLLNCPGGYGNPGFLDWPALDPVEVLAQTNFWNTDVARHVVSRERVQGASNARILSKYPVLRLLGEQFDYQELNRQIKGERRLNGFSRMALKLAAAQTMARYDGAKSGFDAVLQSNAVYTKLLETTARANKEFRIAYAKYTDIFDRARQNLASDEPKCDGMSEHLQNALQGKKTESDVLEALRKPANYIIVVALSQCRDTNDAWGRIAAFHTHMIVNGRIGASGPYQAALMANVAYIGGHPKAKKYFDDIHLMSEGSPLPFETHFERDRGSSEETQGTISRLVTKGAHIEVYFRQESQEMPIVKCRETNKIDGFNAQTGKLEYRKQCSFHGTETVTTRSKPVSVPKAYSAGLKRGRYARLVHNGDRIGIVRIVQSKNELDAKVHAFMGLLVGG